MLEDGDRGVAHAQAARVEVGLQQGRIELAAQLWRELAGVVLGKNLAQRCGSLLVSDVSIFTALRAHRELGVVSAHEVEQPRRWSYITGAGQGSSAGRHRRRSDVAGQSRRSGRTTHAGTS